MLWLVQENHWASLMSPNLLVDSLTEWAPGQVRSTCVLSKTDPTHRRTTCFWDQNRCRGFWLKRKTSSYTVHSSLVKATVFKVFSEQFRAVPHKGCHLAFLWTPRGDGGDRVPACQVHQSVVQSVDTLSSDYQPYSHSLHVSSNHLCLSSVSRLSKSPLSFSF